MIHSPLKFVKRELRESDYESDYDCRIQPIWRPYDSESEEPVYKPVRPSFKTPMKQMNTQQRYQPARTTPVQLKEITEPAFELKPGSPPEIDFAPSPDAHRSVSFVESAKSEGVQRTTHFLSSNGDSCVTNNQEYGTLERKAEAKRLQRVDEMRKRFEQKSLAPTESNSIQTVSSQSLSTQGIIT